MNKDSSDSVINEKGSSSIDKVDENNDNENLNSVPDIASSSSTDDSKDTLLSLSFNQDGGCLAVGTGTGFRICNVSPFQETFRRTFAGDDDVRNDRDESADEKDSSIDNDDSDANDSSYANDGINNNTNSTHASAGGIGTIEMLFRCNLLALVGGGPSPQYPSNKVLIWDDHLGRPIGELSFRQRVLAVKLRRDRICVALRDRVYVYNFGNLALLDTIVTGGEKNGLGLLCISTDAAPAGISLDHTTTVDTDSDANQDSNSNTDTPKTNWTSNTGMVLACPSVTRGQVRVELYGHRKTLFIDAHESPLAAMALTVDGSLLATASERGTIVRLFHTGRKSTSNSDSSHTYNHHHRHQSPPPPGTPLREFRRGIEQAKITSLSFNLDQSWLACASDRGTVHIFKLFQQQKHQQLQSSAVYSSHPTSSNNDSTSQHNKNKSKSFTPSKLASRFLPKVLTKSPKKFLLQGENSYVQIHGIPHPQVCAFVPDRPHTVAVAGLDDYGNGCLLLAYFGPDTALNELSDPSTTSTAANGNANAATNGADHAVKGEARRVAYHRFFKKGMGNRGRQTDVPGSTSSSGKRRISVNRNQDYTEGETLVIQDAQNDDGESDDVGAAEVDKIKNGVEDIVFRDDDDDPEGFVSIETDLHEEDGAKSGK